MRRIDNRVSYLKMRVMQLKRKVAKQKRIVAIQKAAGASPGLASSKFFLGELVERLKRNRAWLSFERARTTNKDGRL